MPNYLTGTLLTAIAALGLSNLSIAQSVATAPVGAVTVSAAANSDTIFAISLARAPIFTGSISGVNEGIISFAGAPFSSGALLYSVGVQPNTYYLQVLSGDASGQFATVTSNGVNTVGTEFESDILEQIQPGDSVVIRPYWTMSTLFPADDVGASFVASTNNANSGRRTEVLIPNLTGTGVNRTAAVTYFFNSFWRRVGTVTVDRSDDILLPDSYITIRGNNYEAPIALTVVGDVVAKPQTVALLATTVNRNDNPVGLAFPADVSLNQLGLASTPSVFVPSTNNANSGRGDELLVYSQTGAGINRTASATYFYNSFWRRVGDVTVNQNDTVIPAGSAVVVRKKEQATNTVTEWLIDYSSIVNLN